MIDADTARLLRCPRTGAALALDTDPARCAQINDAIAAGRLMPASGEAPAGVVEALLCSEDGAVCYPIVEGMSCLLPDAALVDAAGRVAAPASSTAEGRAIQRRQMEAYSQVYERWTGGEGGITRALQRELEQRYRERFAGATVLDVGNGGTTPKQQLGAELAASVDRFIALDLSPDMLMRSGDFGNLIQGDAFALPFQTDSVDIVMVNNTIHHFGRRRGEDGDAKVRAFLDEALRVSRRGVVGVELLVPWLAQGVEKTLLQAIGFAPTFVYSAPFYQRCFKQGGYAIDDFGVKKMRQLTSPWKVVPPVLDITWLRVPTFMIPYSFLFFALDKQPGS